MGRATPLAAAVAVVCAAVVAGGTEEPPASPLEVGAACTTSGHRGAPPVPCSPGLVCNVTDPGRPATDIPDAGTCVPLEALLNATARLREPLAVGNVTPRVDGFAGPSSPSVPRVAAYSAECAALQEDAGVRFGPGVLQAAAAECVNGTSCDAACLQEKKAFVDTFVAKGCELEYVAMLDDTAAAAAAAAEVALMRQAMAKVVPVVDDAVDTLLCTRSDAVPMGGEFCISLAADAKELVGLTADEEEDGPAGRLREEARCRWLHASGCCATSLVRLGFETVVALRALEGGGGGGGGGGLDGQTVDLSVAPVLQEIAGRCDEEYGLRIATTPCSVYALPQESVPPALDGGGGTGPSGGAVAGIVVGVLLAVAVVVALAFHSFSLGRRAERREGKIQLQELDADGLDCR